MRAKNVPLRVHSVPVVLPRLKIQLSAEDYIYFLQSVCSAVCSHLRRIYLENTRSSYH